MKLSVSSGNSLDTLYLSMDGVPAQLPGLPVERRKRKVMSARDDGRGTKWRVDGRKSADEKPLQDKRPTEDGKSNFQKSMRAKL